ncbi:MAG: hypothetical protein R6X27_18660 [Candidatus Desulfacyla sp.]
MATVLIASCGKVFPVSGPERRPQITAEKRSFWQRSLRQDYGNYLPPEEETAQVFDAILDDAAKREAYSRIVAVLEEEAIIHRSERILNPVRYALHEPFSLPRIGRDLTGWSYRLAFRRGEADVTPDRIVQAFALEIDRLFGENHHAVKEEDDLIFEKPDIRLDDVEEGILLVAMAAMARLKEGYAGISDEEMKFLLGNAFAMLAEFVVHNNVAEDRKSEDGKFDLLAIAGKLQYKSLAAAIGMLATLADPEMIQRYRLLDGSGKPAQVLGIDPRFRGDFVYARQTPVGLILIGGRGKNIYGGDAAVIIDLGGDDVYTGNAGAPIYEIENSVIAEVVSPLGVVVDLGGNDRYISTRSVSMGAGFLGVGLLVDLEGDDIYVGHMLTQGAGLMGIGCLMDMKGNDTYTSQYIGQGAGIFGAGLLFDAGGDDLFTAAKYAQGLGGPGGVGELVDLAGNDQYVLGGQFGSGYGTRKIFQGYGQGLGWGWRGHAGGGIGILHDLQGNDVYEAGNFAQGTGYYFGLGLLRDDSGNDRYWGSRYCQGSAAHQAVGISMDYEGNDVYSGQVAANQGAAWDVSVAGCYDYGGDDMYKGSDLSLGAAEQNGIGLFYDKEGKDIYRTPVKRTLGFGGRATYADGRGSANLGIFVDRGGAVDGYPQGIRKNNVFSMDGNISIFLDE